MGTDSISSDALLLLLETVNKQASQIKRLEAVVSGDTFTRDTDVNHGGSDRANKQVQQMQTSLQALEQQHVAVCTSNRSLAEQLHKMDQRMQQLEAQNTMLQQQGQQLQQQLGSPAPSNKYAAYSQHRPSSGTYVSIMSVGASTAEDAGQAAMPVQGMPGGRSMAARLTKLEQQVDALASTSAATEERLQSATSAVQALDDEVSKQLHYIRADVKQAITVANSKLRADMEAAAQARQQEDAAQLKAQLKGLMSELDALVAGSQRTMIVNLTAEMERRAAAAQEVSDGRATALRAQVDRLEEEKADITLVTQYTGQVADVFEQLATTVADSTQASIAQLMAQQQELRNQVTTLSASKADGCTLLQHQQHCQQQLLELQRGLAAAQAAASEAAIAAAVAKTALEPVDALRLQLAETQGTVAALQATAAGLETATNSTSSEQHQLAQQLQQLASSQHMLQQQLMALTNHVDPAAAAQLAAAAAGDESALTFQPLGPLASGCGSLMSNAVFDSLSGGAGGAWEEAWATSSYLQCSQAGGAPAPGAPGASAPGRPSTSSAGEHAAAGATADGASGAGAHLRPVAADAAGAGATSAAGVSVGPSSNGETTPGSRAAAAGRGFVDRMSAVLRHLPVAVRLLRLETAVRDLHNSMAQKAPVGDVHGLQQQLDSISERLVAGLTQLQGVSSNSMRHLEEQSATLAEAVAALGDSLDERPTRAAVQEASRQAAEATQQQLAGLAAELDAVKARLRGAGQDLQQLKDWQVQAAKQVDALQSTEQAVRQEGKQLQQQVAADLSKQQHEVQQLMTRHSADVARDTIKQFKADQEASQAGAEAVARVTSLESKLKLVVSEVDRMQEQATLTARLQDKHTDMMAALKAALSAQSSKYATVSQQLRLELKEGLTKANQSHSTKVATLEASLQQQSDALADLAATLADLPGKGGLLEGALRSAKVTVEELLAKHKQQEERRWEVWLAEFARAIEQRPTAAQLQKQLQAAQQAAEGNAHEAAAQRIECATAALEANLRQQLRSLQLQLVQLRGRAEVLEQGTGIGPGAYDGEDDDAYYQPTAAAPGGCHAADSPVRAQLLAAHAAAKPGFGGAADAPAAGRVSACDTAAQRGADTRAAARAVAAAAPAAGPADAAATPAVGDPIRKGPGDAAAAVAGSDGTNKVNVAAIVAVFEGSPAAAGVSGTLPEASAVLPSAATDTPAAARAGVQPQQQYAAAAAPAAAAAVTDSPAAAQWRDLPLGSAALARAVGAAAAAASPCHANSSVVARAEGSSNSSGSDNSSGSSSEATVEASSIYSSCEGDSSTPGAAVMMALPQLVAGGPHNAAVAAAAAVPQPHVLSVLRHGDDKCDFTGPGGGRGIASGAASLLRALESAAADTTAHGSVVTDTAGPASPSVCQSPELLQGQTRPDSCGSSRPYAPAAAAGEVPGGGVGAQQAYPTHGLVHGGGGNSSSRAPIIAAVRGSSLQQQQQQQQHYHHQQQQAAVSVAEAAGTDCASELQQLLDLQQQVQQCLVDSGCLPVGRRAKPPRDRSGKKGHKRTRVHGKEGSNAVGDAPTAAEGPAAGAAIAAAGWADESAEQEGVPPAPEAESSAMSVDNAIAAAAAALGDRRRPAAAAAAAAAPSRQAAAGDDRTQQQQQQGVVEVQLAAPVPAAALGPLGRPSRSQEIRSLLTLQQQLAQCLREHGCFLEQQRQQQQHAAAATAESFVAPNAVSSVAALQHHHQQQQQYQAGAPHVQRLSVQETELEQLLVLQAQMQQAVRHNST